MFTLVCSVLNGTKIQVRLKITGRYEKIKALHYFLLLMNYVNELQLNLLGKTNNISVLLIC